VRAGSGHGLWEAGIREQIALVSLPRKARFHGSYSLPSVVAGSQGVQSLVVGYPTDSLLQRVPFARRRWCVAHKTAVWTRRPART